VSYYLDRSDGLGISLRVQPRASRNKLVLDDSGQLKAYVTAPPVDSAANDAVLALLAEAAGVPRSRVQLLQGQRSRDKVFLIAGAPAELRAALEAGLTGR
jgi:uncharacterized protein (TIGR00251 family)